MLPDLPLKGDCADWIEAGGTRDQLEGLAALAPDWTPSPKVKPKAEPAAADVPTMQAYHALRDTLDRNNNGVVLATHANMVLILKGDPLLTGLVEFNSFTGMHILRKPVPVLNKAMRPSPGPYPRPWDADDVTRLLAYVQKSWANNFKRATVQECLLLEGRDNEVHPVREYLASLKWDGQKRLDGWLTKTFGCPRDAYHDAVASKLPIAAVRRVRQPGCKYDQLVVLEGFQGIGKSPAISILFSADWTTDQISDLASKDAAIDLRGKWCVELAEIKQLIKSDAETVKAFLSRSTDHYRPPYAPHTVDVPRQSVLIGTTNAEEYLSDPTGNRRIWPVKCLSELPEGADLDWLRDNRDQLWAEAAHREAAGETIWLDDAMVREVATVEQAARLSEDPWEWKVKRYCDGKMKAYKCSKQPGLTTAAESHMAVYPDGLRGGFVTVPELLDQSLNVPDAQQTKGMEMRVANILKSLGWKKERVGWGEQQFRAWHPPKVV
jgi:predicted P-loop ATPase